MVKDNRVAWHAGKSKWKNFVNLNRNSLGIEFRKQRASVQLSKFREFTNNRF